MRFFRQRQGPEGPATSKISISAEREEDTSLESVLNEKVRLIDVHDKVVQYCKR